MNRERLRQRKFLRELSFVAGTLGVVLALLDWLVAPLLFPSGPWWVRLCVGAAGLALLAISREIDRRNKLLGKAKELKIDK